MTSHFFSIADRFRQIFGNQDNPEATDLQETSKNGAVTKDEDDIAADFRWFAHASHHYLPTRSNSASLKRKLVDAETQTSETDIELGSSLPLKKRAASIMEAVDQQVAEADLGLNLNTTLPFHARRRAAAHPVKKTRFGLPRAPIFQKHDRPLATVTLNHSSVMTSNERPPMDKPNTVTYPNLFDPYSKISIFDRLETPMHSSIMSPRKMMMSQPMPRSKSTGTFPERPMPPPPLSVLNREKEKNKPHQLKRPRVMYYGAGCRMDDPPIRRAKRFDATFGPKYDRELLEAYAHRPVVDPTTIAPTTPAPTTATNEAKKTPTKGKEPAAANNEDKDDMPPTASLTAKLLQSAINRAIEEEVPVPLPVTPYKVVEVPPKVPAAVLQHREQVAKRAAEAEAASADKSAKKRKKKVGRELLLEKASKETKERLRLKRKSLATDEESDSMNEIAMDKEAIKKDIASSKQDKEKSNRVESVATDAAPISMKPTTSQQPPAIVPMDTIKFPAFAPPKSNEEAASAGESTQPAAVVPMDTIKFHAFAPPTTTTTTTAKSSTAVASMDTIKFPGFVPPTTTTATTAKPTTTVHSDKSIQKKVLEMPGYKLPKYDFSHIATSSIITPTSNPTTAKVFAMSKTQMPCFSFVPVDEKKLLDQRVSYAKLKARMIPKHELHKFLFSQPAITPMLASIPVAVKAMPQSALSVYKFD
ncbi:hypothetical protein BDF22DRAFT_670574 [Syncephalis plumigaleata]|nr:hypothetical protein BDF22DRAFT_670574 [Syncephalis plumigaleata]